MKHVMVSGWKYKTVCNKIGVNSTHRRFLCCNISILFQHVNGIKIVILIHARDIYKLNTYGTSAYFSNTPIKILVSLMRFCPEVFLQFS
jgi:hypothetical protein